MDKKTTGFLMLIATLWILLCITAAWNIGLTRQNNELRQELNTWKYNQTGPGVVIMSEESSEFDQELMKDWKERRQIKENDD